MLWKRYTNAHETWAAMLADIAEAKTSVDLESYIIESDGIGEQFFNTLASKASAGVRVRVLCDMVGSYSLWRSDKAKELREKGVAIRFFNPIRAWRIDTFTSWFFRDHRKLLVVDGSIGYVGGVGIRDEMCFWRDTHVRAEGPVVQEMTHAFQELWQGIEHFDHPPLQTSPILRAEMNLLKSAPITSRSVHAPSNPIYRDFIAALTHARSYIYFTTPYFIPPFRLLQKLRAAAKRGVDVRILVPRSSDLPIIDLATSSYLGILLRAGVRVFSYIGNIIHAKTAVSDDKWVSVGSSNLDNLSLHFNYEGNLVANDPSLVATIKDDFLADCEHSHEITRKEWKRRPLIQKIKEVLTWPIHGFF